MEDTITLWRPTGQAERDLVARSGWKKWPPRRPDQPIFYPVLNRPYATRITREWNVPEGGVGYVTSFEVRQTFLGRHEVHNVGGKDHLEYWVPAQELEDLNANILGAILEISEFRAPVPPAEIEEAENHLGHALPRAWREYLLRPSWFRRGWLSEDCYLRLHRPAESVQIAAAWQPSTALHPGILLLGDDGAGEHLALDMRTPAPRVVAIPNVSAGWDAGIEQAESVESFLAQVEAESFTFRL